MIILSWLISLLKYYWNPRSPKLTLTIKYPVVSNSEKPSCDFVTVQNPFTGENGTAVDQSTFGKLARI